MRKTDSAGKARDRVSYSARELARSWPKGFSMTTRFQPVDWSVMPWRVSWSMTRSKRLGGTDR